MHEPQIGLANRLFEERRIENPICRCALAGRLDLQHAAGRLDTP